MIMQKRHLALWLPRRRLWRQAATCQAMWGAFLWACLLAVAVADDWQWHAVGNAGQWAHSASYSVISSSGASAPFTAVTNAYGVNYGGFIFPYDRRVMRVRNDFDGDGKSDCWYYHSSQVWYFILSSATQNVIRVSFGSPDATPIPEDYDGDHKTDIAVYQESSGTWTVMLSSQGYASVSIVLGGPGYIPVPADFDGDQKADPAVYQSATGGWTLWASASGYEAVSGGFGGQGYAPLAGDFDEDDKADPVVYNENLGALGVSMSGSSYVPVYAGYGGPGFTLIWEDYDGDGCADAAAYERGSGLWYVMNYRLDRIIWGLRWGGGSGYQPIAGDYDGDGLTDAAVFYRDRHDAIWYMNESTDGPQNISARGDRR